MASFGFSGILPFHLLAFRVAIIDSPCTRRISGPTRAYKFALSIPSCPQFNFVVFRSVELKMRFIKPERDIFEVLFQQDRFTF